VSQKIENTNTEFGFDITNALFFLENEIFLNKFCVCEKRKFVNLSQILGN